VPWLWIKMSESSLKKALYSWRVRAGLLGIILVAVLAKPNSASLIAGFAVCLPGLLLRAWAAGHLRKDEELTVSGPFRGTRNPLYLGNLVIGLGIVIASRSIWVLSIVTVYFLLFYPLIIRMEVEKMTKLFPQEYTEYSQKTPLFFPFRWSSSPSKKRKLSWELYLKNKEWRALLGTIVFWLIMLAKLLLF
jgi:protein-S-isoprenylcysteine O-methyltransferase Ste14